MKFTCDFPCTIAVWKLVRSCSFLSMKKMSKCTTSVVSASFVHLIQGYQQVVSAGLTLDT